jgi:hypothetical protein
MENIAFYLLSYNLYSIAITLNSSHVTWDCTFRYDEPVADVQAGQTLLNWADMCMILNYR